MDLKSYTGSLKSNWTLLVQGASVICFAVGGFVNPPDIFDPVASTDEAKRFAFFIVAVLAGVFFYFAQRWSRKKNAKGWMYVTIILLATLVTSDQIFKRFKAECTCGYNKQIVLIGNLYTPQGDHYSSKHPGITCDVLLMDFAGRANTIWTADSINACRFRLILAYLFTFSTAALSLLSMLQIIRCYEDRKEARRI